MRYFPLAFVSLALVACSPPESSAPAPAATEPAASAGLESDTAKTIYALGVAISSNVSEFKLTAEELALVADGLRDGVLGNELKVDIQTYGPRIQALGARACGEPLPASRSKRPKRG